MAKKTVKTNELKTLNFRLTPKHKKQVVTKAKRYTGGNITALVIAALRAYPNAAPKAKSIT